MTDWRNWRWDWIVGGLAMAVAFLLIHAMVDRQQHNCTFLLGKAATRTDSTYVYALRKECIP